jgi:DeoR/GlpR family transcriptional regulator of sugar metabolism
MLKEERLKLILENLEKSQKVILGDLSKELNVSEDTIRRDIKELSAQKLLKEVRGGAIPHAPGPQNIKERAGFAGRQKQIMAKKAVKLLTKNQVVILDSGTSAAAVAGMLPKELNLTVITNSFLIANMLEDRNDIDLYFAGGRLLRESFITTGHDAISFFQSIRADICFLGICSIDVQLGLTGHHYDECAVKKAMIAASGQVMALTTPEKLNTAEAFYICPLKTLSGMITPAAGMDLFKPYKEEGINVI